MHNDQVNWDLEELSQHDSGSLTFLVVAQRENTSEVLD